jgi:hypothetical protein
MVETVLQEISLLNLEPGQPEVLKKILKIKCPELMNIVGGKLRKTNKI